jgi:hypothetical protein
MACVAATTCTPIVPSSSMVGDWSGRVAPFHFAYLEMRITQHGSSIDGVACYTDPEGATDGKGILFSVYHLQGRRDGAVRALRPACEQAYAGLAVG